MIITWRDGQIQASQLSQAPVPSLPSRLICLVSSPPPKPLINTSSGVALGLGSGEYRPAPRAPGRSSLIPRPPSLAPGRHVTPCSLGGGRMAGKMLEALDPEDFRSPSPFCPEARE